MAGGRGRVNISSANFGVNKWVRAPNQYLTDRDGSKCFDGDGSTLKQLLEVTSAKSLNESNDPFLERRGAHKLVAKRARVVDVPEVERSSSNGTVFPSSGGNERDTTVEYATEFEAKQSTTFTAFVSQTGKRQSPRLHKHYGREDNIDADHTYSNHHKSSVGLDSRTRDVVSSRGPRRICLNNSLLHKNEQRIATEKGEEINFLANDHPYSDLQPQKTLTDFCYQDTGRGSDIGSRRGRGNCIGHTFTHGGRAFCGKNLGLVRVKPHDLSTIPICPTFPRGLQCNNVKCPLRHDVSTEASRPICVFFQRNGMCSKGDECPFKHVKLRWDAEICPTFSQVGYCEDPYCLLRHVVTKIARID